MKITEFFPNEADNLHCLQSCVRMIISTEENRSMRLDEAEVFTDFQIGKLSWPYKMLLEFAKREYNVINIENLDQVLFTQDPETAIRAEFGDLWENMKAASDIEQVRKAAVECLDHPRIQFERRIPDLSDIVTLLEDNWWILVNVNSRRLSNQNGYSGHFVLVDDIDKTVTLQNPGLPAYRDQTVTLECFLGAWQFPDQKASNIMAFKAQA